MLNVIVVGGTGAGRRRPKQQPKGWMCPACEKSVAYYWKNCPSCSYPRP